MKALLSSAVQEPGQDKVSASRLFLVLAGISYCIVFAVWFAVVFGIFLGLWPWERFGDAIVVGGLGLLGVIFGAVGSYSVNRWSSRTVEQSYVGYQDPKPPIGD